MVKSVDSEQRTIETRLNCSSDYELLDELLGFYAKLRHRLWRDLIVKELSINDLKSFYIKTFFITARQFNSLAKDVSGMAKSLEELKKTNLKAAHERITLQRREIDQVLKKAKALKSQLSAIAKFRQKIADWKRLSPGLKKPKMPQLIRGKFKERLLQNLHRLEISVHQKSRRLGILECRLTKLKSENKPSLCFGSKKLFKAQFHLDENDLSSHGEWLEEFRWARSSRMTFVGSSDETAGNQTVQYDPKAKTLSFRLPNAEQFKARGKYFKIEYVEFPEFLREEYLDALSSPATGGKKNQKSNRPLTYRFVRRINKKTRVKAYYLQVSFAISAPEKTSLAGTGVIAVDLNADHLAVCETDRFGNWIDSYILPFDLRSRSRSSNQAEAIIGDLVAIVSESAQAKSKPIALEELDFSKKKMALRALPKWSRKGLSQFAYAQFMAAMQSRTRREGVSLISINPAYTSLIGAYKYQGLKISSHEKAALAIARRAQGFTEELEVFQGTLPSQVMMTEKTKFRETSRHVWGFYGDNQKLIRKLFIEKDRRPILPINRAISLAGRKTSLHRSLIVTREKRVLNELRCSSG